MTSLEKLWSVQNADLWVGTVEGATWATDGRMVLRVTPDTPHRQGAADTAENVRRLLDIPVSPRWRQLERGQLFTLVPADRFAYRCLLDSSAGWSMFANEAYLRLVTGCRLMVKGPHSAIRAFRGEELIALIAPLNPEVVQSFVFQPIEDEVSWAWERALYRTEEDE